MAQPTTAPDKSLHEKLNDAVARLPPDTVTLARILELVEREGLLILCVFLTIPFLVPVSIPGVSTVFGAVILMISVSLVLNRMPPLPRKLKEKSFPSAKLREAFVKGGIWLTRLDRISRPHRMRGMVHSPGMGVVNGLMVMLGALLLMAPFGFIPFSNTLPGVAILLLAMGMLQADGGCILLGYLMNVLTIIYFGFLIAGGTYAIHELIQKLMTMF